jgi:soluble lytic murein transglycosylase
MGYGFVVQLGSQSALRIVNDALTQNVPMLISRFIAFATAACLLAAFGLLGIPQAYAQASDDAVLRAKEAYRQRNLSELTAWRDTLLNQRHPLAGWADHWLMQLRLPSATPDEVDQFLARWGNDYVADRLRNDWLLELGRRQDWRTYLRVLPDFRMNDDQAVVCYGMLARYETSRPASVPPAIAEQARQAWWQQKTADEGCHAMAQGLVAAQVLNSKDIWRKVWLSHDAWQPQAANKAARLLDAVTQQALAQAMAQPARFLSSEAATRQAPGTYVSKTVAGPDRWVRGKRRPGKLRVVREFVPPAPLPPAHQVGALNVLALQRWGAQDAVAAAQALRMPEATVRWRLSADEQAWAWASLGRQAASNLLPQAIDYYERAWALGGLRAAQTWSPETLTWWARAALRSASSGQWAAWALLESAIDAMPSELQQDPAWVYWRARALLAKAPAGAAGESRRRQGQQMLVRMAAQSVGFYGLLARDDLADEAPRVPARPTALSAAERAQARATPGLDRALRLYALDFRSEGAREWNYTLSFLKPGGMGDRELMAAADWACEREVWDRCINTSERTRQEIDLAQRFPMPFKNDIISAAQSVGLEPAYMFGLIRQESRFHVSARSGVGASGLMQVMPATAAWTARKLGMSDYRRDLLDDRDVNLKLGAGYLKLMVDEFAGSQAMAAAGYNAGPGRPRRWRDGPTLETAAWAENIPFNETRDYVKKVLTNAATYAHLLHGKTLTIKNRLGAIGPRTVAQGADNADLP